MTDATPITDPRDVAAYVETAFLAYRLETLRDDLTHSPTVQRVDGGAEVTIKLYVADEDLIRPLRSIDEPA